jgi:hypothetical protein
VIATDPDSRTDVLLSVSRHVSDTEDLQQTFNLLCCAVSKAVDASGATIELVDSRGRLRVIGSHGMPGPGEPFDTDGLSVASSPIALAGHVVGTLNVYQGPPVPWSSRDLELLTFVADHAATALRIAELINRQSRQLVALERGVRSLREQTHEYANRVHSISALIAMNEPEEARRFIADQLEAHARSRDAVVAGIEPMTLAGLLLAEITIARQSGIELEVDPLSRLTSVPTGVNEAELVAVVGQMLEHALEAVRDVPRDRRRIVFHAASTHDDVTLRVTDSGGKRSPRPAVADGRRQPLLARCLLEEAVSGAGGHIEFEPGRQGTTTVVTLSARRSVGEKSDGFEHARNRNADPLGGRS